MSVDEPTAESETVLATNLFNQEFLASTARRRAFVASLSSVEQAAYQRLRSIAKADPGNVRKRAMLRRFCRTAAPAADAAPAAPVVRERVSWNAGSAWRNDFLEAVESGATVAEALSACHATTGQFDAAAYKVPSFRRRLDAAVAARKESAE